MCKIQKKPGELRLKKLLETIDIQSVPLHFIHFKWSIDITEKRNFNAATEFECLNATFKSLDGTAFICHDNDIVAFIRPETTKKIHEIYQTLITKLHINENHFSFDIYETRIDSLKITKLCKTKIFAYKEFLKVQEDLEDVSQQNSDELLEFEPTTFKSIPLRRQEQKPLILLVEDDSFSRHLVKNILRNDFTIIEAENTVQALNNYVLHAPDIVFLDINLPDNTGLSIISTIKKYDPEAFIVMLSGNAYPENISQALSKGAHGFIAKPFNKQRIFQSLDKCPHLLAKR